MTGRARRLSGAAAAVAIALSGCSVHPGAAVVVGSQTITHGEVDELADALCSANVSTAQEQGQAAPELPTRGAREAALQVLLETALSQQFGESEGVEPNPQLVSQAVAQNEQGVALLPEDQRAGFRAVLEEYYEADFTLIEAGRESLEEGGQSDAPEDQALAEGQRLRAEFAKGLDVEVDPRYGSYEKGAVQPAASSLSVPASEEAMAGARAEPAPAWVSSLPASQKCS